jgi:Na+-translocating ferredoxin:NAD+ oxidoreductase RnfD subunit
MSLQSHAKPRFVRSTQRFFGTPKGIVTILLAAVTLLAIPGQGASQVALPLLSAMAAAAAVDILVVRLSRNAWTFPSGAILTGLIVALILAPEEPWIVPIATAILAITSKHLFRTRLANVFNPAALALVIAAVAFHSAESWWGALPDLGWAGIPVLVLTGGFIANRINKLPLVLVFLGTYFTLFAMASFVGDATQVAEIFRAPDLHMVLFFAFFMLDDPPTCPVRHRDQVQFALIVAFMAYTFFMLWGWLYFLPAALLVGNVREAWRRRAPRPQVRAAVATRPG